MFASADESNMGKVADALDGTATLFASNVLQIVVQSGNPKGIERLADLAKPNVKTVLCAPAVPCGTASHKLLDFDGVEFVPASEEQNVKAVLTKVLLGEADAGLVYQTDVTAAAGTVDGIDIAGADRAVNFYPIATLAASKPPDVVRQRSDSHSSCFRCWGSCFARTGRGCPRRSSHRKQLQHLCFRCGPR